MRLILGDLIIDHIMVSCDKSGDLYFTLLVTQFYYIFQPITKCLKIKNQQGL